MIISHPIVISFFYVESISGVKLPLVYNRDQYSPFQNWRWQKDIIFGNIFSGHNCTSGYSFYTKLLQT